MSAFNNVIKEIRDRYGYSQEQLAKKLNVSRSAVSMWERGKREPDFDTLMSIADAFKMDISYLLRQSDSNTDRNNALPSSQINKISTSELSMIEKYRTLDSHGKHNIDYLLDAEYSRVQQIIAASKGEAVDNSTTIAVPLLQNALSGKVIGTVPVLAKGDIYKGEDDLRAVQVTKDTMAPRFSPGDTIIYRRQSDVQSGDIAIIIIDGQEAVCKKFIKEGDTIKLVPLNTKYETKVFHIDDIKKKRLEILGKVVENIQAV